MKAERIAVVGAGAVGCYFGAMLARAGFPVTLIGRPQHVEAIKWDGLGLKSRDFDVVVKIQADTRMEAVRGASIVLLCVKTLDTETAATLLAPYLATDALLISF